MNFFIKLGCVGLVVIIVATFILFVYGGGGGPNFPTMTQ